MAILSPKRGCRVVTIEIGPDSITETVANDRSAVLRADIGDHLLLVGAGVDEVQDAEVLRVELDGFAERLHVRLGYGALAANTNAVHVTYGRKAKTSGKRRDRAATGKRDALASLAARAAAVRAEVGGER
jgi:hypothetical protein